MFRNVFQLLGAYFTKTPNAPGKEVTSSYLSAHLGAHSKALWYGSRAGRAGGSDGRLFLKESVSEVSFIHLKIKQLLTLVYTSR